VRFLQPDWSFHIHEKLKIAAAVTAAGLYALMTDADKVLEKALAIAVKLKAFVIGPRLDSAPGERGLSADRARVRVGHAHGVVSPAIIGRSSVDY
jgi:hypothetical protein